jgi:hypothetical protein
MKKILTLLLMVATVIGMTMPALANPQVEPIAVAQNVKDLFVQIDGAIPTTNNVGQGASNAGNQDNLLWGEAAGGNAESMSADVGVSNSGASSGVIGGRNGTTMGQNDVNSDTNIASVLQGSAADAYGGSPAGVVCGAFGMRIGEVSASQNGYYPQSGCTQVNDIYQNENTYIDNTQTLVQPVTINEWQASNAEAPAWQTIEDSMFDENDWYKEVTKEIN